MKLLFLLMGMLLVAELAEEASSSSDSHSLQRTAMAFPEGPANLLTNADHIQHWPVPADCMLPSWEPDSALSVPSISTETDLEMYGSGVSSGEICCMQYNSIFDVALPVSVAQAS